VERIRDKRPHKIVRDLPYNRRTKFFEAVPSPSTLVPRKTSALESFYDLQKRPPLPILRVFPRTYPDKGPVTPGPGVTRIFDRIVPYLGAGPFKQKCRAAEPHVCPNCRVPPNTQTLWNVSSSGPWQNYLCRRRLGLSFRRTSPIFYPSQESLECRPLLTSECPCLPLSWLRNVSKNRRDWKPPTTQKKKKTPFNHDF